MAGRKARIAASDDGGGRERERERRLLPWQALIQRERERLRLGILAVVKMHLKSA